MKKFVAVAVVSAALIGTAEAERLPQVEDIYNTCLRTINNHFSLLSL